MSRAARTPWATFRTWLRKRKPGARVGHRVNIIDTPIHEFMKSIGIESEIWIMSEKSARQLGFTYYRAPRWIHEFRGIVNRQSDARNVTARKALDALNLAALRCRRG